MNDSSVVVLSVGSNHGNRHAQVAKGLDWLSSILSGARKSSIYTTGDCHGGKRDYMNAVVIGTSQLTSSELDNLCKRYELANGRTPEARANGDVPIDIDIVIFNGEILRPKDYRQNFFQIGFSEL